MDVNTLDAAAPWFSKLVVFDLETTGVDVEQDRIVTAHVGLLNESGEAQATWDWLVNPGVEIPAGAQAVHGISTEKARALGQSAAEAVAEILAVLFETTSDGTPLVAYNASYDLTLLDRESRRYGLEGFVPERVIDPLVLDKAVDRYRRGKRTLSVTCEFYGVSLESAHEASSDAIAAGRLARALAESFPELAELSPADLHERQIQWSREQAESFQSWKRANGDPAFTTSGEWPIRPLQNM